MKVTVDFDCTPEEARRLMGLPDLSAVHGAYVDKMTKAISEGLTPDTVNEMMKAWSPMGDASMTLWKTMVDQMSGKR